MDENEIITEETKKEESIRSKLSNILFDKINPEMITQISRKETDRLSILLGLTKEENYLRRKHNIEDNILTTVLHENLVLRTSIAGWRSKQGVKIITSNIEEEQKKESGFANRIKNMLH